MRKKSTFSLKTRIILKISICLAVFILPGLAYYHFYMMKDSPDDSAAVVFAAFFACFFFFGISSIRSGFIESADGRIVNMARRGLRRKDNTRIVVTGTIEPVGEPLLSPFSRTPCVYYEYSMSHEDSGGDSRDVVVRDFSGEGQASSEISTATGKLRLLGPFSATEFPENKCDDHEKADEFIRNTNFDDCRKISLKKANRFLDEVIAQDSSVREADGPICNDRRYTDAADSSGLTLKERVVPAGAEVCVFGKYSSRQAAIICGPDEQLRVRPGGIGQASLDLKAKFRNRIILGLVFIIIAAAFLIPLRELISEKIRTG